MDRPVYEKGFCDQCYKESGLTDLTWGKFCCECLPIARTIKQVRCPSCNINIQLSRWEKHFDVCAASYERRRTKRFG